MRCSRNFPWSSCAFNVDTAGLYFVCCLSLKKKAVHFSIEIFTAQKSTYLAPLKLAINQGIFHRQCIASSHQWKIPIR